MNAKHPGRPTLAQTSTAACGCCGGPVPINSGGVIARLCRCHAVERCLRCCRCFTHCRCPKGKD